MFIKVTNGVPEDYTIAQLRREHPSTSFPSDLSNDTLAAYGIFRVKRTIEPNYNKLTQTVQSVAPVLVNGEWVQRWEIVNLSNEKLKASRLAAYRDEADPLFFKWQAGEATKEEWLAKRAEIRSRFPYGE